jgi:predicted 3-demethylubiquinone-9 3-methyltransferase (glyoxalase superfamily)
MSVSKIATHLWFDNQAEEAAKFYTNLFEGAQINKVIKAPEGIPRTPAGSAFIIELNIMGQEYIFLNGGKEVQCGWLTDKFGLSWQIIPKQLEELMGSDDAAVANRVTAAMLKMTKIDVAGLERAAKGD